MLKYKTYGLKSKSDKEMRLPVWRTGNLINHYAYEISAGTVHEPEMHAESKIKYNESLQA